MLKLFMDYYNLNNKRVMEFLIELTGAGLVLMAMTAATYIVAQLLHKRGERAKKKRLADMCSSLECVRCNRKLSVLREARRRLTLYILECGNRGLCRLQDSLSTRFHYTAVPDIRIADDEKYLQNPVVFQLDNLPSRPWWWLGHSSSNHHKHSNGKLKAEGETVGTAEQFKTPGVDDLDLKSTPNPTSSIISNNNNTRSLHADMDILHRHFGIISEEFNQIWSTCGKVRGQWKTNATSQGQWSLFHLQNQGQWLQENAQYCPKTVDILSTLPNLMTENVFGNVSFSVLYPDTDIAEHYGPTNTRIRCHLGLLVPSDCYLTIGNQSREWKSGECILFDDSYLHSAHHHGTLENGPRVVLLMDLWHPDICPEERQAIECIFPPDIQLKQPQ